MHMLHVGVVCNGNSNSGKMDLEALCIGLCRVRKVMEAWDCLLGNLVQPTFVLGLPKWKLCMCM